jgi:hypothetical protein
MKILEIGPSFSPVALRSDGWNAWSVDHADQEGLREKYRTNPAVDTSRIGPVDFVWKSGDLDAAIPVEHHGTFGACIASHVIEHMPDPLSFYRSLDRLIQPSGIVALAVPDKRFCFDYFRPLSMTSDFILAHSMKRRRHSKKTAFDHTAYAVSSNDSAAWGQHPPGNLGFYSSLRAAYQLLATTDESEAASYVDYHAWCYTPSSFKLVMLELNVLELSDWQIDFDYPTEGCEFIVILKKGRLQFVSDESLQDTRKRLLQGIIADLAEQHSYLLSDEAAAAAIPSPSAEELARRVAALEQQHCVLAEGLARQEARLAKIWESAKMTKRLLRPVRAIAGASSRLRARL